MTDNDSKLTGVKRIMAAWAQDRPIYRYRIIRTAQIPCKDWVGVTYPRYGVRHVRRFFYEGAEAWVRFEKNSVHLEILDRNGHGAVYEVSYRQWSRVQRRFVKIPFKWSSNA